MNNRLFEYKVKEHCLHVQFTVCVRGYKITGSAYISALQTCLM